MIMEYVRNNVELKAGKLVDDHLGRDSVIIISHLNISPTIERGTSKAFRYENSMSCLTEMREGTLEGRFGGRAP